MSVRYPTIAGVLVAALALSTPAFAGPPKGGVWHHGCGAYRATQAFKAYVFRAHVPQGGSVASIGFASFGCRGAGERRYPWEVAWETCVVTGSLWNARNGHTASARSRPGKLPEVA